jgi:hypothetical protein
MPRSLDEVMPSYDVRETHQIRVRAPAPVTFQAFCELPIDEVWLVNRIIRLREWLLGAKPLQQTLPAGFLDRMQALGWGTLAEEPGRLLLMGAVTQPWEPNVVFRPLPLDAFLAFQEPGAVRIAWIVRVDAEGDGSRLFTETRAAATDARSRAKFRRYWLLVSPGVRLIRHALLRAVRARAEYP